MSGELDRVAESLAGFDQRWNYSIERLAPFADERSYGMNRALVAAARLFGFKTDYTRSLVGSAKRALKRGGMSPLQRELYEGRKARVEAAAINIRPLCGWVYRARLVEYPHIFKIGITGQPERRIKDLAREAGTPIVFETLEASTYFEEAFRLLVFGRLHIRGEWFFDPDMDIVSMPEFLDDGWGIEKWKAAATRNRQRVERGENPLGALGAVYLSAIETQGAA